MNYQRDDVFLQRLGHRIKELREKRGLTPSGLANELELDRNTIYRIEKGMVNVTAGTLKSVAEGLGVPLSELFKGL
jgi:transcriptional regulator with XRE-family HTH domain